MFDELAALLLHQKVRMRPRACVFRRDVAYNKRGLSIPIHYIDVESCR